MAFSLVKGGKLQGKQKWLQMAFCGTGQWWKLGSVTGVTIAGSWHSATFHDTLKKCNTQLYKLSTDQVQSFSLQILTGIPNNKANTTTGT
jgi:hypothetical protein